MNILQLDTGLFPDAQTVIAAVRRMAATHSVRVIDLRHRDRDLQESDWDGVIRALLAADLIVST